MAAAPKDVLQGTLDLLVLKTLSLGPMHGWGISNRIRQLSADAFQIGQGSLYPALHRLARRGLVSSEWKATENNREAKYYTLTPTGSAALGEEIGEWTLFAERVALVLSAKELPA